MSVKMIMGRRRKEVKQRRLNHPGSNNWIHKKIENGISKIIFKKS